MGSGNETIFLFALYVVYVYVHVLMQIQSKSHDLKWRGAGRYVGIGRLAKTDDTCNMIAELNSLL